MLITGGTRGIGRRTALACAGAGAQLVVCFRHDEESADELRRELDKEGGPHRVVRADITSPIDVDDLIEECRDALGGLDGVVNNAGVDGHAPIEKLTPEEWARVLDANLTGAFLVSQGALKRLTDNGSIVNIGASVALRGRPGGAHYAASKAALLGLTRSLSKEVGRRGIRVNTVAPGVIETGPDDGPPPEMVERIKAMTALGRLGTAEDVAAAVLFLVSDASRYVTGTTLNVDGGM
ncbi:SDR family NAD(P)-dependent oxidoreductase [Asanoa iriomotensis]|uniref:Short-chain dehydrogenase n=1 Tax=Asanoa iriomotensis TaxID=234613 RepID=A0ABQ4C0Y4_9ACTN|nr:short-chain dehydrogenase [Asanoa iriomotensis]